MDIRVSKRRLKGRYGPNYMDSKVSKRTLKRRYGPFLHGQYGFKKRAYKEVWSLFTWAVRFPKEGLKEGMVPIYMDSRFSKRLKRRCGP